MFQYKIKYLNIILLIKSILIIIFNILFKKYLYEMC